MSDTRAPEDPSVTRFETTAEWVDGQQVGLAETYFYAESGGQPADRGTIGGVEVADVQHGPDGVVHVLAEEPSFDADETVEAAIDPEFRTYCMRAHTASHVLYGAGRRLFEDLGYGGFDISPEKVRVDLSTPSDVDDAALLELERLTNRVVWEGRDVGWETMGRDEAMELPTIAFNTKTEEGVLADSDTVRVVTVEDWDVAACGGTHVANTREIGPVSVLSRSNPGEGLTRVEFAVGPTAIQQRVDERGAALDAARTLGCSIGELPDEVDRLQSTVAELEDDLAELRGRIVEGRIADLADEPVERDGATWVVGTVAGVETNALGERAKELAGDVADVVALVGDETPPFVVVASDGDVDAGDVVDSVTDEFGGGGGGGGHFAQGGGLDADPADVVDFLRRE